MVAKEFSDGEIVELTVRGERYEGRVIPSYDKNVVLLKLSNGYNLGFNIDNVSKFKKIKSAQTFKFPSAKLTENKNLPNISLITTGGTITSKVDYTTGGVISLSKPEELLINIPELYKVANLKVIRPFNIMSEDMQPEHWQKMATLVASELNKKEVSGVVISHGTDTLHWSSAILSFMLRNLNKPVALVGGQRSSDRGSFDGALNLICGVHYCLSDIAEVAVVMHESTEDKSCIAIRGVSARKLHSSRRDAFRPINELPLARIFPNGQTEILNKRFRTRNNEKVVANTNFNPKVALVKFMAGMKSDVIDYYIKNKYKGIIIEGTGLGHVTVNGKNSWLSAIRRAIKENIIVCMTSQCIYGRVNPSVYTNLRMLSGTGVVYLENILPEVAYIKLGYILAHYTDYNKIKERMVTNLVGEIIESIPEESFLY